MRKLEIKSISRDSDVRTYSSIAEAATYHRCDESTIRKALNRPNRFSCGRSWHTIVSNIGTPKILILDIETAPIRAYTWALWKQDIGLPQIISDWFMISWAAKWLASSNTMSDVLSPEEIIKEDDFRITKSLWHLLDEADIVVAHYGNRFDIPKIKTRCLIHGLFPPSPYKQVDTKEVASREFGFSSNKLEALAKLLGFAGKNSTKFELWSRCMQGDLSALKEMRIYNVQDIDVLENVYLALRPYIRGHPNLDLYIDSEDSHCPSCGHDTLELIPEKFFYTQAARYQIYRCRRCGAICRAKKGTPYTHKKQVSAIPR